jgi:uncharacterized membrane protein
MIIVLDNQFLFDHLVIILGILLNQSFPYIWKKKEKKVFVKNNIVCFQIKERKKERKKNLYSRIELFFFISVLKIFVVYNKELCNFSNPLRMGSFGSNNIC